MTEWQVPNQNDLVGIPDLDPERVRAIHELLFGRADELVARSAALRELTKAGKFDPAKHPRFPKGHPLGGKFMPKPDAKGWYNTGDVETAVWLLARGERVRLEQPRQVATLITRLHQVVKEMESRGEKAPNFDLCRVAVKGTNIFCHKNKGIPRIEMPQLKGKPTKGSKADKMERDERGEVDLQQEFKAHLIAKGVKIKRVEVPASHLRATQRELNGAKIAGMMTFLRGGGEFEGDPLFVSNENYVVDGHHRWAAEVGDDFVDNLADKKMVVDRIDMDIIELLRESNAFAEEYGIPQAGFTGGFGAGV